MKWLVLGLSLLSSTASGAPCAVPTFDPAAVDGRAPRQLDAAGPLCSRALTAFRHFRRMAAAASLSYPQDVRFQIRMTPENNAYHSPNYEMVSLTEGLLARSSTEDNLILVVSHELGHSRQWHSGLRGPSVQMEGHADALGAQIMLLARYPPEQAQRGREARTGCTRITAPGQQATDHPADFGRWQNVVAMTGAHMTMRDGLAAARSFDGRARSVPWVALSDVGSDGVVRPGARVRRTLAARVAPRLGGLETQLRGPGQAVPRDRVVVSDVPVPFSDRRLTVTRRVLNYAQLQGAGEFNRAVGAAASRIESFTGAGPVATRLTGRFCGRPLDYRTLTSLMRDASAAAARMLRG